MSGALPTFSERAWAATTDLRRAIDELPFLAELGNGSLPPAVFQHYLEQDALYLGGYARALALLAARAPDTASAAFWASSAHTCAVVEAALHADLLADELFAGTARPLAEVSAAPTTLGYVSYLVATAATAPYAVGAAAVLPCYWVYADVGQRLAKDAAAAPVHQYRRWVEAYGAEEFQAAAHEARRFTDEAAESAPQEEPAMHTAFAQAVRYERQFWAAAHARETWPALG